MLAPLKRVRHRARRALHRCVAAVRDVLVRAHLIGRAATPYLPSALVTAIRRARAALNRSAVWRKVKTDEARPGSGPASLVARVFDADFYAANHRRAIGRQKPLQHYLDVGWRKRFDPSPMFATGWYLEHFVAEGHQEVEPLAHYLQRGWREGRDPSPWFSTHWYSTVNPDIGPETNPLVHYVEWGHREGRTVSESHTNDLLGDRRDAASTHRHVGLQQARALSADGEEVPVSLRMVSGRQHDLVSFDVWDTLLVRDRPADAAKVATARRMAIAAEQPSSTWSLFELRVRVEATMAGEVDHEEYELEDVLRRTIETAALRVADSTALAATLAEAELQDELAGTVPIPESLELLSRLLETDGGPAVVALSDFYIGAAGLARLLRHHGVDTERVTVVSSVDEGASKRLGTIYKLVQSRFDVVPSRHLHIGDNVVADGEMARAAGADVIIVTPLARHLPAPGELARSWYVDAVLEVEAELDEVAATTVGRAQATISERTAFAAGVRAAAFVVPFVAGAMERAIEVGVDTVHYLSREGASAARLHAQVADTMFGRHAPRAVHLEVSRRSTFGASLQALDGESLSRMWRQYTSQSPIGLLASLNLDPAEFAEPLRRAGLEPDAPIGEIGRHLGVRQFLERPDVEAAITSSLRAQRAALLRYLDDRGFDGATSVVVDVGWRGTIQDNLCHLLPDRELHGVYLGLFPFLNPQPANATKRAVIFDGNRGDPFDFVAPPAALEAPLTPPIPSVLAYRDVEGRIEPIPHVERGRADDLVVAFQDGLRLGAPVAARRYVAWGASTEMLRTGLQESIRRYYARPSPGVADIWFFSAHDDTFGALNVTPYGKSQPDMSLTYGDVEPRRRVGAEASLWAEGWAAWLPVRALDVIRRQRKELQ